MIRLRSLQAEKDRIRNSRAIQGKLLELKEVERAEHILVYLSLPSEVQTGELIEKMRGAGKTLYIPLVEDKILSGIEISRLPASRELKIGKGPHGIPKPLPKDLQLANPEAVDLVLMPGLAFDLKGGRIGFGSGYYDRLLEKLRSHIKRVGMAFDFQIAGSLPQDDNDVPVDILVTESRTIRCNS